jgi:hypothetical protein
MLRISAPIVPERGSMSSWVAVVVVMGFLVRDVIGVANPD